MKIRVPKESEIISFTDWWTQNKAVYTKINIDKDIAHTIWCAATDATKDAFIKAMS